FLLGITAAAYASSDSALAALTTSFCVDFLGYKQTDEETRQRTRTRILVHIGFSILICAVIIVFQIINDQSVVTSVFKAAGYTYGPLLGMFAFGIFSKRMVRDRWIPYVCLVSPILSYILSANSKEWLYGYEFGFEILLVNGLFTFIGLWLLSLGKGTMETRSLATRS